MQRDSMVKMAEDKFVHDVTRQKQIQAFLDINLDILCVFDLEGNFCRVNRVFEEILGYSSEELEGNNFLLLVHAEDIPITEDAIRIIREKKKMTVFISRFRCKDGTYKYMEWHAQRSSGKVVYASARDITENKVLLDELRKSAFRDELTGLYNRHYFETMIVDQMELSDRYKDPLSMAILDLDNFKAVNDTWGHPVGDEQLKHSAKVIERTLRSADILARIGGEEFLILMPETSLAGAIAASEKVRAAIENHCHPITGKQTASFGVAERMKTESFRHWMRRTDNALYRAKQNGRNRVIASDETQGFVEDLLHIEWNDDWQSENNEIDQQHQQLINIANRLVNLSQNGANEKELMHQLDELLDYIRYHFDSEENLLTKFGYPEVLLHAQEHQRLLVKAIRLKEDFQHQEVKLQAFFSFLVDDVILGHMVKTDMKFFPYVRH